MYKVVERKTSRDRRKAKIRSTLFGTSERPRISVFRSNKYIYAQVIDDSKGITLASTKGPKNVQGSSELGKSFALVLKEKNIKDVVFDRSGYIYHGRVKSFADGLREGGLTF